MPVSVDVIISAIAYTISTAIEKITYLSSRFSCFFFARCERQPIDLLHDCVCCAVSACRVVRTKEVSAEVLALLKADLSFRSVSLPDMTYAIIRQAAHHI